VACGLKYRAQARRQVRVDQEFHAATKCRLFSFNPKTEVG
jgi:hypothetical protein